MLAAKVDGLFAKSLLSISSAMALGLGANSACSVPISSDTVSPAMAAAISAQVSPFWKLNPQSNADWEKLQQDFAQSVGKAAQTLAQQFGVEIKENKIVNIPVFWLHPTPDSPGYDEHKAGKLVLHLHGGGYILGHGVSGIGEAVPLAGLEGYTVLCVDYRMAPQFPFPAATNDNFAVYRELLKTYKPEDIIIFGSSAGGALTLVLALQAVQANVPLPSALVAGSPWAELSKKGDTYTVHDGIDNVLGTYDYLLRRAAEEYANGADMSDPLLSPVNASDKDLKQFPPTLLLSGTRDLFLSNTVRMHQRLIQNQAPSELIVYEGQSHVQYYLVPDAPETKAHYKLVGDFMSRHFGLESEQ